MKKKYFGPLFSQNMWAAAKACTSDKFDYHMRKIEEKSPNAIAWLDENHPSGKKKKRECPECHELGHTAKYCQGGPTASQKKMRLSSNDPNAFASTSK